MTLRQQLDTFAHMPHHTEDELSAAFAHLAPYLLYGGYVRVLDRYCLYIQRVEFYFHSEADGLKDDIVYHRNNYHIDGQLPYFTPLTFHAHVSGYDIAFENEKEQYRASALIRAYEIYDKEKKMYLKAQNGRFVYSNEPHVNTQSTYLYAILNGFGDAGVIEWVDEPSAYIEEHAPLKQEKRQGVYVGTKWQDEKYKGPRERKWSFARKESIF